MNKQEFREHERIRTAGAIKLPTLADIAAVVGVSPVYLTQLFQQVEGLPLYRYQLQRRLARALDRLGERVDLTELALDLGFSSYSHFKHKPLASRLRAPRRLAAPVLTVR